MIVGGGRVRLGVNIDHVATLRNARKAPYPDIVRAAGAALAGGADHITVHLREDRRHIRDEDLKALIALDHCPVNMELAATQEMVRIASALKPDFVCIVPERREEVTTEGGLDVAGDKDRLREVVKALKRKVGRIALFIDPEPVQIDAARSVGADAVELHAGPYCGALDGEVEREHGRLESAAERAMDRDMEAHAGHGFDFDTAARAVKIFDIIELNIGHFLIAEAVFIGLDAAVAHMRRRLDMARGL